MAYSGPVRDSYNFTMIYDGCCSRKEDKTESIKLSYEFVELLQEKAKKEGIKCFLPHLMIKPGKSEAMEIYNAVKNCDLVITVMTDGYLDKVCGKKHLDKSKKDPNSMLQRIHYNVIHHKNNGVVPIYLQTEQEEISLCSCKSIQFINRVSWENEENWKKIWDLIPTGYSLLKYPEKEQAPTPNGTPDGGTVLEYMSVSEMERYRSNNSLGKSRFGEVSEGLNQYRQKKIAVEICQKAREKHELQFVKERTVGYIRHPFLLPLFAVAATPDKIYLMYPYMERGDLDHVLKNARSELEQHHRCRIIYQVCEGLQYLHSSLKRENVTIRNTVLHMNIKPSNILLDQDWNARLRFHGPTVEATSVDHSDQIYQDPDFLSSQGKYRKEYDVFSVGVVMWRLMGAEEEFLKEFRTEDGKFQVPVEEVTKKVIIKAQEALPAVWPGCPEGESNCTTEFAKLALKCVKPIDDRINLDDLQCRIKMKILYVGDKKDTFIKPSGKLCCKCNLNNAAKHLHPKVNCSQPGGDNCVIFCQDCLTDHYRNPLYCPTHGPSQPPIGHDDSFAVLVGGFDEENPEIYQNDVLEFKRVLINHNIMGFRESQVYMILCDEKSKSEEVKQKIKDRIDKIKEKTSGHPEVTFVFFYSGHGTKEGLDLPGDGSFQITKGELQKLFEDLNASEKLIILDCCFAASKNLFEKGKTSSTQRPPDSQIKDESSQMVGQGMEELATKAKDLETDPDGDSAGSRSSIALTKRYFDKGPNPHDSDNFCHYEWWSCAENQKSQGDPAYELSVFTKHMVNGLKSGHKCGLQGTTDQCNLCKKLQEEALVKGYISPEILHSYVFEHVKKELDNYKIQQPMNTHRERRPMKIAYYNKRHLCQEVVVFTPKETLVIKLTNQVEAKLSDIKDYIAGEMKEKGLFPSSVTGDQLCLMEEALHKEIDDDKELQQSLDRNFPLHCCLRTAQTNFKLLSGPIVLLHIDRGKLIELLDHLVTETTGKEGLVFKAEKVRNRYYTITFCAEKYKGNPIKFPSQYQQDEVIKEYISTINYAINSIHDSDQDKMRVVKSGVTFHVKIVMDKYGYTPEELDWAEIVMV